METKINLEIGKREAMLLQACLGNQMLKEKIAGTQSEFYYFAKEFIAKIGTVIRNNNLCSRKEEA